MQTLEVVENEIKNFSPNELAKFRLWFSKFDSVAWDRQIELDAASGKLDVLAQEAIAEFESGKAREI